MTKHYVEFYYPGSFFSETDVKPIKSRDAKITLPERAYAYRIFDREEIKSGRETLVGKPKNYSPRYIKGEKYDLERVKNEVPDSLILQSNMRGNDWKYVIKCRQGFIEPWEGDVIL